MLFPWRALSHRSKQRFWCPERVLFLVDFWHREQTFVQAALWPGGPGAGDGRMLLAVPHLADGLEGAQSSFLARGVLIAAPVQAVDHRLRGEAVHVCDHPLLRPKTPHHLPSPALSRTQTPPQLLLLRLTQPSFSEASTCSVGMDGWRVYVCGAPTFNSKLSIGPLLSFWKDRMDVFASHKGASAPSVSSYCFCLSSLSLRGSYWLTLICLTKKAALRVRLQDLSPKQIFHRSIAE